VLEAEITRKLEKIRQDGKNGMSKTRRLSTVKRLTELKKKCKPKEEESE
jgi:hypothetical protein